MTGFAAAWLSVMLLAGTATAQPRTAADTSTPIGEPQSGGELRDPDFRVGTRQFGLERRVEMYQWSAADGRYRRVWNQALIDSSGFDPGYENPPEMPLDSARWWAGSATLDGRPLAPSVLRTLGQWQVFRPGFARLPANLAATFQPEGDGLGSAEDPLDPQIGDLRLSWRELVLPPVMDQVELRDGVWHPRTGRTDPAQSTLIAADPLPGEATGLRWWPWLLALLVLGLPMWLVGRRLRRRAGNQQH